MVVAYDGTAYAGWQVQPGAQTVQGALEAALKQITRETTRVQCSGRTDAGVHSIGQVAHFDLAKLYALDKLQLSLNAVLPEDIRVLELRRARADFHARFSPRTRISSGSTAWRLNWSLASTNGRARSKCATCPMAWTPASVRPLHCTRVAAPVTCCSAVSIAP